MAGRIPETFIQDLIDRTDIVEVVGRFVPLKRAGREFTARCPFHDEKTPSFTVSPEKQFYHCFGCGAHGSALGFLMQYQNLEFPEAVEDLARAAGVEVPREDGAAHASKTDASAPLYAALTAAQQHFTQALRRHPEADKAIAYLKARGLTGEVARDFGLGFAPPEWDSLSDALGERFGVATLERAGLVIRKGADRCYDRFRGRITFPIHDQRGRVIAFGGRALGDETPKYLNSPESPVFHKGRELYHLHEARRHAARLGSLVVVEGYMDVIALAQFGVLNTVATLGTAATREHCERLFRATSDVVFCFDGDAAGQRAAWRAAETCLPLLREGRYVGLRFLPSGEDPDSLVRREGPERFTERGDVIPVSEFIFRTLAARTELDTLDGRARMVELARPYLGAVPPGALRTLMLDRLAELTRSDRGDLERLLAPGAGPKPRRGPAPRGRAAAPAPPDHGQDRLLMRSLQILAQHPRARTEETLATLRAAAGESGLPRALCDLMADNPDASVGALLELGRGSRDAAFPAWLLEPLTPIPDAGLEAELSDALERFKTRLERRAQREALRGVATVEELTPEQRAKIRDQYSQGHG